MIQISNCFIDVSEISSANERVVFFAVNSANFSPFLRVVFSLLWASLYIEAVCLIFSPMSLNLFKNDSKAVLSSPALFEAS